MCVNEEMLAAGVGSVGEVTGVTENAAASKFMSGLVQSERVAKTRGKGVWQGSEHVSTWNRMTNYLRQLRKSNFKRF